MMEVKHAIEFTKNFSEMYTHGKTMREGFASLHEVLVSQQEKITALELVREQLLDRLDTMRNCENCGNNVYVDILTIKNCTLVEDCNAFDLWKQKETVK